MAFFAFNRSQEAHVTLGITTEFLLYDPNVEYQAGKAVVDSLACENGNDADERDETLVQVRGFFGSPTSGPRRWWRLARGDSAWIYLVSPPLHEKPRGRNGPLEGNGGHGEAGVVFPDGRHRRRGVSAWGEP